MATQRSKCTTAAMKRPCILHLEITAVPLEKRGASKVSINTPGKEKATFTVWLASQLSFAMSGAARNYRASVHYFLKEHQMGQPRSFSARLHNNLGRMRLPRRLAG